jgi:glycosyltransferase involved in cell wall biosynthesis
MRLVVDLQGAQFNRLRGIGRYTMSLVQTMARLRPDHEIFVVLNGASGHTIDPVRAALDGLVPPQNILVWSAPTPVAWVLPDNQQRARQAELVRENFIAALRPDWVLVSSLFEGLVDDAVTSIGVLGRVPTAVILYDLIPWIYPDIYLKDSRWRHWYLGKIDHLKRADLLLSISASSGQEAVEHLEFAPAQVANISTATGDHFQPREVTPADRAYLADGFGLIRPFVMYTGGIDHRKNIEGLVKAFAALPQALRQQHQLAVVCAASPEDLTRLRLLGESHGLAAEDLVLTGYVSEDDLVLLYNACHLFVFPSWHEGFGLPVLEAMHCGKPVIASNRASLPEVMGRDDALFDPYDVAAMAAMIERGLVDEAFRNSLAEHGLRQCRNFSWEATATRAWQALEAQLQQRGALAAPAQPRRPRMAFLSPLPPERSGIADYSAELLRELTRFYRVDVFIRFPEQLSDAYVRAACGVHPVEAFRDRAHRYDRVLYQFGNSEFHEHMFTLLPDIPGVVVLHDFYLSGVQQYSEVKGWRHHPWAQALVEGHGYEAVYHRFIEEKDATPVVLKWPANYPVLRDALGVVVHSEAGRQLAHEWYGEEMARDWSVIPLLRVQQPQLDREAARQRLGIGEDEFVVCSYGILAEPKLSHRVIEAWTESKLAGDEKARLVFVGRMAPDYRARIQGMLREDPRAIRVEVTGYTEPDVYRDWLAAADAAVQLRMQSRGETSAAVLDCMNYGIPTVANAHGSMAELDPEAVWLLPDRFDNAELVAALEKLAAEPGFRQALGARGRAVIRERHSPRHCAQAYFEAIEAYYGQAHGERELIADLADTVEGQAPELARALARNMPPRFRFRRLLVDVSPLTQPGTDGEIVRVARQLFGQLLHSTSHGLRVEPVYGTRKAPGYRYARRFTCRFLGIFDDWAEDEPAEAWQGDVFIGLDFHSAVLQAQSPVLEDWRLRGVRTVLLVHNLLPLLMPERYPRAVFDAYLRGAGTIAQADAVAAVSESVLADLRDWLACVSTRTERPLALGVLPLGTEVRAGKLPRRALEELEPTLAALQARPSFLIVGAIEARKGHAQALTAFEELWAGGLQANLVIAESSGLRDEEVVDRVRSHAEAGKRLHWLENVSEEVLEHLYPRVGCALVTTEAEGSGLLVLDAARHGIPVLARDLPSFREAGGEQASYFADSRDPHVLALAIEAWLRDARTGILPRVAPQAPRSWDAGTGLLLQLARGQGQTEQWTAPADGVLRYWGNDVRLATMGGERRGRTVHAVGQAGFVVYGPPVKLQRGRWRFCIAGSAQAWSGKEWFQVACENGEHPLLHLPLPAMPRGRWSIEREVTLDRDWPDVEVRLWVDEVTRVGVESVEIAPLQQRPARRAA